ncbi:Alcohol dehydrogenase [NADP+] A [Papilio machaon]|uniref:Alcohol dehydrogenase [NADP+] A n=1 Tax=Papilio machaon TaxID=76193 RepID=A0A194QZZ2_PAPMA|nr:Alcohol dehydrogenase [NADP+] A [Papilio machaon]
MALSGIICVEVPKLKLNNGKLMPAIALGTYLGFDQGGVVKSVNKQLANVVMNAIDIGYRHFDTAAIYETEEEIGEGIRKKIEEGAINRDDIFVTTKLWNTQHKREQVPLALKQSLNKMGLNYVDLYLMHWPIGLNDDYTFSDVDFMETWRGLEDVQTMGLTKSIGVSNFNLDQLKILIKDASIKPVAIQVEVHPQMIQSEIIEYAKSEDMVVMGYSPFGSLVMRYGMQFPGPKIDEPVLVEIARKYNKTTPQVVLRWQIDRNVVPLPKSTNLKRLKENIDIFDFKLEQHEIEIINKFHNNVRYTLPSFWQTHPYYPFEKIDNPQANPFLNKRKE